MPEIPIIEMKDLKLYFKYAPVDSSNYFYANASQSFQFDPISFYSQSIGKDDQLLEELELSRKELQKSTQNYLELMKVIDGVNLKLLKGQNMSIIGESGCGKTTLLFSLLNLPQPELRYMDGQILYDTGEGVIDLLKLPEKKMRLLRGLHFSLVPQLAKTSINPWLKIGLQTGEILEQRLSEKQELVKAKVIEYLGKVTFPDPKIKINKFVHQISGGEAQKIVIAMALISNPRILLADEILSSLDVISQSQVMELLKDLNQKLPFQFIYTTHNLAAAMNMTEVIAIMYAGEIVETTSVKKFLDEPLHPYSLGLLSSAPWYALRKGIDLEGIEGEPPLPYIWPEGCRFSPRCKKAFAKCNQEKPPLIEVDDRQVACWLYSEE